MNCIQHSNQNNKSCFTHGLRLQWPSCANICILLWLFPFSFLGWVTAQTLFHDKSRYFTGALRLQWHEDVPLVELMYLVFTRMPRECYRRRLRLLLLCLRRVFRVLINSLGCSSLTLELLRRLRHYLRAQNPGHHTIDRLEEQGVEKERPRRSFKWREKTIVNETNIWNGFKGKDISTSESRDEAHINVMGFSERIHTILNWTELTPESENKHAFCSRTCSDNWQMCNVSLKT